MWKQQCGNNNVETTMWKQRCGNNRGGKPPTVDRQHIAGHFKDD
ncbi:hypothetical protein [Microcoleus sp. D2_18a_B4]